MYLSLGSCVWADIWQVEWAHYRFSFFSSHFCTSPVLQAVCHLSSSSNLDGVHGLQTTMDAVVGTADIFNIKILASFSLLLSTGSNSYYSVPLMLSLTPFHITYQGKSECLLHCFWESVAAGLWKSSSICNFKMPKTSWKCKAAMNISNLLMRAFCSWLLCRFFSDSWFGSWKKSQLLLSSFSFTCASRWLIHHLF